MTKFDLTKQPSYPGEVASSPNTFENGTFTSKAPPPYSAVMGLQNGTAEKREEENEEEKEKKEKEEKKPMVGIGELFSFTTTKDRVLLVLGVIFACVQGATFPLLLIVFGDMTDSFIDTGKFDNWWEINGDNITSSTNLTRDDFMNFSPELQDYLEQNNLTHYEELLGNAAMDQFIRRMNNNTWYYLGLGGIVLIVGFGQLTCWLTTSYSQCQRIRTELFRAILRQDIGWFDTHEVGELNTRLSDDVNKIQEGIGDKLGQFFQYFSTFIGGFVVGFVYGWQLTLVILAISPLLAISGAAMAWLGSAFTSKELKAYARAGAVAEQALSSIRTVMAFGGEKKECLRYDGNLTEARSFGVKKGTINGSALGVVFFILNCSYALAFWYGNQLVRSGKNSGGDILVVFFSVLVGAFSLGNAVPNIQFFSTARGAAHAVYSIIKQVPSIDSSSKEGKTLPNMKGNVEFRDVRFNYPSRKDVNILQGVNLKVEVGQTAALVGASGCGKSTIVQLIQRFYDPDEGTVLIDGVDIKELNINWLRQHVGVVSQEPILFATTIGENIRYGRDGVTQNDVEAACKKANAHDFIMKLPRKYDTLVGERGVQLSGGQKQRIAIARALIKDPKILLLDEATSALDTESESIVQSALDKARQGRTTLVIAHRLSTIRNADIIMGFNNGVVEETGTHEELMKFGGIYYILVTNQTRKNDDDEDPEEEYVQIEDEGGRKRLVSISSVGKDSLKRSMSVTSKDDLKRRNSIVSKSENEEESLPEPPMGRILSMNAPDWPYILGGCICALINGAIQPTFAIVFSEIIAVFADLDPNEQEKRAIMYSLIFVGIGVVQGLAMFLQSLFFAISGENLTISIRRGVFKAMMQQVRVCSKKVKWNG
uniref:Multidrug resistance protein 1-like isoform 1 n=1 Tax=Perinereis aibuhitensis TaxID=126650 RepID=A0A6M3I1D8_PERAI|nr:multidrug resistance protein 1-like isoform 1 [Perinereis aibuhitensis]